MGETTALAIRLEHVAARFEHRVKGAINAVDDVSLDVRPGELLTLLGPSGCGKTTTLRMIAGFQEPSAGRIFIGERDVTRVEAAARDIGFVFQSYALFPHLNVFENVAYGLRVRRRGETEIARATGEVLGLVGLAGYEPQMPHQLSGGEQQRVALARAIVIRPRVLLFDEPLSNLDAKLRVEMRAEIRGLQRRLGITTVYVTHDQEEAMAISDRIAVMSRGRIAQLGVAEDLYRRPASEFIARFIGQANLIAATVVDVSAAGMVLDMAGVRHTVSTASTGLHPGQRVKAVVRPEAIGLTAATEPGAHTGTVVTETYLGDKVEVTVDVAGAHLHAVASNPRPGDRFSPGAVVGVKLPADALHLLPGDAT